MQTLLDTLAPVALELAGTLASALVAWLALVAKQRLGLDIEARHRAALDAAIMTGVRLALRRVGVALPPAGAPPHAAQIETAVDDVKRSVPDAVKRLRASEDVLRAKVAAAIGGAG
ncbi:hypothetical protein FDP22_07455 [Paroceanicella profunda]|uniref:Uncharacterized protein n=1 Tax=Paroceanicella profunda TaxID=2579971 RepID=A0A5B8FS92_9RHOB|nr:hypothetical protein [Paroceanicella profunda]QDL91636.1 hypothetical protein FDP22_07455 [Paroceanicella profunda]